jgi:hypothetical protein
MICYNGRFGWVPFTHKFKELRDNSKSSNIEEKQDKSEKT